MKLPESLLDNKEHEIEIKLKDHGIILSKKPFKITNRLYKGNFDGVNGLYLIGWAYNENSPQERVNLVVLVDGVPIIEETADLYREDLKLVGIGDGKYGFKIKLPESIIDNKKHEVRILIKENNQELPNSPKEVEFKSKYEYSIEGLKNFAIEGKIIDITNLSEPVGIEVWEGDKVITSGYSDPNNEGKFYLWLPSEIMDGKVHCFTLRTTDGYELGYLIDVVNYTATPFEVLKQYSKEIPTELTSIQRFRLKAFLNSLKFIINQPNLSNEQKILQIQKLNKCLEILSTGYESLKNFETLEFPRFQNPKVSIVIPVHNKFEITYCCLASILLATYDVPYEVIVVDDGSTDKTLEIKDIVKNIKLTRNETAQGFVKACNKGAKLAEGEYIVILNNDTEVLEGWLKELLWVFENYDKVGIVGAKLLYPDLTLQEAGNIVFGNGQAWNYGRGKNPMDPKYNYVRQVDYCSGACIMLPKSLWDELGGFDEEFAPAYWEETDLSFRVREKGYIVVYTPFAQVIHYEGISCGKDVKSGLKQYQVINQTKFKRKWIHVLNQRKHEQPPSFELAEIIKDRGIWGRVLCIDYEVPRPDKEAGGYATFQEIKLFQSLGYKVTFIPQNMAYLYGYVEDLQRNGVEVVYAPFYKSVKEFLEKRGKEFDIFYIVRWYVAAEYIDLIRSVNPNAKILFNNADLHFLRELREALSTGNKEMLLKAIDTREKELEVMRKVDLVLSYNEVEHAVILSHNLDSPKVAKWPWVVYPKNIKKPFEERRDITFLGNYRHFPNISAVKFFIEKVMPKLRKELPEVRFLIYGSHLPEEFKDFESEDIILKGYVKDLREVFENCRVFVTPLVSGAGIKGKVLEALSYGVLSVLSPVAAEGTGIRNALEAFIVEKPEEYVEAIKKLYNNKELWEEMSEKAVKFIQSNYSFEKARETVLRALEKLDIYLPYNKEGFYVRGWNG
ncbi:MAG: glycosyltransferase [Dictyoglomus thermophilum]|nr:glycosyltransferase [Dictyoglomus thermophilum]MCX7720001.1 glycosyltransferase [Dictyoglomus thermophilum]